MTSLPRIKSDILQLFYTIRGNLGTASKPKRRLTGGSVRFRSVSIVLNNDNGPEAILFFVTQRGTVPL